MNEIIVITVDNAFKHPIHSVKLIAHGFRIAKLLRAEGHSARNAMDFWMIESRAGFISIRCEGVAYLYNTRTKDFLPW